MAKAFRSWKTVCVLLLLVAASAVPVIGSGPNDRRGGYKYAILSFDTESSPSNRVWTLDYPDRREAIVGGAKEVRFELKMSTPIEEIRERHILNTLGSMGWKLVATTSTQEGGRQRCNLIFTGV